MSFGRFLLVALFLLLLSWTVALIVRTPSAGAHPVSPIRAAVAPSEMAYVKPRRSVTFAHGVEGWNCPPRGWFSDVSAYRWNGGALGEQEWPSDTPFPHYTWRDEDGRSITFDGITFRNHTRRSVLVAGWCG